MPYRFDLHVRLEAVHTPARPAGGARRRCGPRSTTRSGSSAGSGSSASTAAGTPPRPRSCTSRSPRPRSPARRPRPTTTRGSPRPRRSSSPSRSSGGRSGGGCGSGRALRSAVPLADRRDDPDAAARRARRAVRPSSTAGARRPRAVPAAGLARSGRRAVRGPRACPATEPADDWQPAELAYSASFAAGPVTLTIPRHDGGDVDWYSATARGREPDPRRRRRWCAPATRHASPTTARPHPRWWQIEDHRHDPGAVAPHRTHLAAMLLIHVTASHGDDWFTAPAAQPDRHARGRHRHAGRGRDGPDHDVSPGRRLVAVPRQRPAAGRAADLADRGQPAHRHEPRSTRCSSGSTRTPTCSGRSSSASTASSSSSRTQPDRRCR